MFSGTLSSCEFLKLLFLDDWGGRYDLTDRKKKYNRHSRASSMLAPNTTTALCLLSPFGTALTRTYCKVRVKTTLHVRDNRDISTELFGRNP